MIAQLYGYADGVPVLRHGWRGKLRQSWSYQSQALELLAFAGAQSAYRRFNVIEGAWFKRHARRRRAIGRALLVSVRSTGGKAPLDIIVPGIVWRHGQQRLRGGAVNPRRGAFR